jgi:hypothetical protein
MCGREIPMAWNKTGDRGKHFYAPGRDPHERKVASAASSWPLWARGRIGRVQFHSEQRI